MPEELENGGFILKTHQMPSAHITPQESKTRPSPVILICVWKKLRQREMIIYFFGVVNVDAA